MKFDTYNSTVPAAPSYVQLALSEGLWCQPSPCPPRRMYKSGLAFSEGIKLSWGGFNPHPFVEVNGQAADLLSRILRQAFPNHRVARADVAYDFLGDRLTFKDTCQILKNNANRFGLITRLITSPTDDNAGQTLYVGSRKSEVFCRFYEKSKQLQEVKGIASEHDFLRLEFEIKPLKKNRKERLATLSPLQCLGFSTWSKQVAKEVMDMNVEYLPRLPDEPSSAEKALRHMMDQYANTLSVLASERSDQYVADLVSSWVTRTLHGDSEASDEDSDAA